jgi:fatty-acyl-CoA synthase
LVGAQEVLGPYGVTGATLTPAYGLAEGTLSVTMKPHLESPRSVWIDREAAYNGELSLRDAHADGSTAIVSCGPPMPGVEIDIERGALGRIRLRSVSLADGYFNDPQVTAERFVAGTFQTEDLGFIHNGELCVLGRTDDVIVFAGRNVYARDIEHDGVRTGCSAIVDGRTAGQPHMVLVAEPSQPTADLQKVAADATAIAFRAGGLHLSECVFVRPGQLPKTPSGKVQRFRCRALLADNGAAVLDRVAT